MRQVGSMKPSVFIQIDFFKHNRCEIQFKQAYSSIDVAFAKCRLTIIFIFESFIFIDIDADHFIFI